MLAAVEPLILARRWIQRTGTFPKWTILTRCGSKQIGTGRIGKPAYQPPPIVPARGSSEWEGRSLMVRKRKAAGILEGSPEAPTGLSVLGRRSAGEANELIIAAHFDFRITAVPSAVS